MNEYIINLCKVADRHHVHECDAEWFDADTRTDLLETCPDAPVPTIEELENFYKIEMGA